MPALRQASKRYAHLIDAAWPLICRSRFCNTAEGGLTLPPHLLWALTASGYAEDEAVQKILALLSRIDTAWPDALSTDAARVDRRWEVLRSRWRCSSGSADAATVAAAVDAAAAAAPRPPLRLPADAAVFYLLGASLLSASPIGTLSGDFGPDFEPETEREVWRIGLSWPPLTEEADLADPPSESYELQSFKEYGEFYDPQGVHYGRPLFSDAEALFLAAGFTEFAVHGTEMWLSVA